VCRSTGACESCTDGIRNGAEEGVDCGGTSCPACAEDCTNGLDDDGDGLVDCADSACSSYQCVPEVSGLWSGPVLLHEGNGPAPTCGASWPTVTTGGSGTLSAPQASCSPCACDPPSGATCPIPSVRLYDPSSCTGAPDYEGKAAAGGACTQVPQLVPYDGAIGLPAQAGGGTCAPSGGQASVPPAQWASDAVICSGAKTGGGCSTPGSRCAPRPGVTWRACIWRAGDTTCPSGVYTYRRQIYTSIADSRGCTSCACSNPVGIACTGKSTVYGDAVCSAAPNVVAHDGSCTALVGAGNYGSMKFQPEPPSGGSCLHSLSTPTGSATGSGMRTVCCIP
jgi:hypothetical protein